MAINMELSTVLTALGILFLIVYPTWGIWRLTVFPPRCPSCPNTRMKLHDWIGSTFPPGGEGRIYQCQVCKQKLMWSYKRRCWEVPQDWLEHPDGDTKLPRETP